MSSLPPFVPSLFGEWSVTSVLLQSIPPSLIDHDSQSCPHAGQRRVEDGRKRKGAAGGSLGRAGAIFEISNPDLRCRCGGPGQCRGRGV